MPLALRPFRPIIVVGGLTCGLGSLAIDVPLWLVGLAIISGLASAWSP